MSPGLVESPIKLMLLLHLVHVEQPMEVKGEGGVGVVHGVFMGNDRVKLGMLVLSRRIYQHMYLHIVLGARYSLRRQRMLDEKDKTSWNMKRNLR